VLRTFFILCVLCLSTVNSQALVEVYQFDSDQQRQRYQSFVDDLRCPKCQNQNLAGSDSPIASDLRRELHELLKNGMSDKEIVDFMVDRYGDYVLYSPRLQPNTWLLWFAPLALLLVGGLVIALIVRRRNASAPERTPLTKTEQDRLNALLKKAK